MRSCSNEMTNRSSLCPAISFASMSITRPTPWVGYTTKSPFSKANSFAFTAGFFGLAMSSSSFTLNPRKSDTATRRTRFPNVLGSAAGIQ
jgi:hypothetical protein